MSILADSASGVCVFCGRGPLTNEHVWPQWIRKGLFPHLHTSRNVVTTDQDVDRDYPAPAFDTKVGDVCGTTKRTSGDRCNNGWMSRLETSVKDVLGPMIRGETQVLSPDIQVRIASWALKTAMMFDLTHPENEIIPRSHFVEFYSKQNPPGSCVMWLARVTPSGPISSYHYYLLSTDRRLSKPGLSDSPMVYLITLRIEHLAIQIYGLHDLNEALDDTGFDHHGLTNKVVCIWPPQPVDVASDLLRLTPQEFEIFHRRFIPQGAYRPGPDVAVP